MDELAIAMNKVNPKKAAGIDGVPGKIIKIIYEYRPHDLLGMLNSVYNLGIIPNKWNIARLIPLAKPGKDPPSSYIM
jgi:hypothetical protein